MCVCVFVQTHICLCLCVSVEATALKSVTQDNMFHHFIAAKISDVELLLCKYGDENKTTYTWSKQRDKRIEIGDNAGFTERFSTSICSELR